MQALRVAGAVATATELSKHSNHQISVNVYLHLMLSTIQSDLIFRSQASDLGMPLHCITVLFCSKSREPFFAY